jgi:di/tricarboxylate transporter
MLVSDRELDTLTSPFSSKFMIFDNTRFSTSLNISDKVSQNYTKESNMIFLTGVIVALALEYCNLHRRIALKVMLIIGSSPAR